MIANLRKLREFDRFVDKVLENPEAKTAYEDHQSRNATLDTLRTARLAGGLSCREVSRRMECSDGTVRRLEHEGSDPTVSLVQRYAAALGYQLTLNLKASNKES
jgi:ribosome-binding protein aMBF1 (putative translation factor)